jgi:hypothetical protein
MKSTAYTLTVLVVLLAIESVCAAESDANDSIPSISFGAFPLPLKRTYVISEAGTPADKANMNDPFPNDYPPCTTVMLEDIRKFPESKEPRYYFPSRNVLRVYRISNVNTAPYKTIQADIKSLRKLLKEKPTAIPDDYEHALPDYPPRNSAHAFQVKLSYLDTARGSAVCYVTQFTQDGGTPANNEELTYIVQGISKDNQFYVSADFSITHPKLPNRIEDTPRRTKGDYGPDRALLSKQADSSFAPALDKIRTWLTSLQINEDT